MLPVDQLKEKCKFFVPGFVLGYAIIAVVCSLEFVSPWFFLVSLVTVVTGGFPAYASVCLCYITDLTAEENRGTR